MLKILEKDDTESSICDNTESRQSEEEEESSMSSQARNPQPGPSTSSTRKRSKLSQIDETDKAILKALEATSQPPPPEIDEDSAFFKSVTPAVRNFTEDEKLEFRMGVLTLIKQIKAKRSERPLRPPSSVDSYQHTSASYHSSYSAPTPEYQPREYMLEELI